MKGKITIGKVTCSDIKNYVRISIEDELSSTNFITVKMDIKSFGEALLGLGNVPVEFELQGIDKIGKKLEHKTVEVMTTHSGKFSPGTGDIDIAVAKYEVDGWHGEKHNCMNFHDLVRCINNEYSVYRVHYFRWVAVEDKSEE